MGRGRQAQKDFEDWIVRTANDACERLLEVYELRHFLLTLSLCCLVLVLSLLLRKEKKNFLSPIKKLKCQREPRKLSEGF